VCVYIYIYIYREDPLTQVSTNSLTPNIIHWFDLIQRLTFNSRLYLVSVLCLNHILFFFFFQLLKTKFMILLLVFFRCHTPSCCRDKLFQINFFHWKKVGNHGRFWIVHPWEFFLTKHPWGLECWNLPNHVLFSLNAQLI